MTSARRHHIVAVLLAAILVAQLIVTVRTAWVGDDAYITFRTVDNAARGFGLRWNVAERVQAYTHPLWMFALLPGRLAGLPIYGEALTLSILFTIATGWLIAWRVAASRWSAILAIAVLVSSRAFVDYSTSGLENALTHVLIAALFWQCLASGEDRPRRVFVLAALCLLNRLDTALLIAPTVAVIAWQTGLRRTVGAAWPGVALLAAWELFSVVYYGFPFPNTAYAKLQTWIPRIELVQQGLRYLRSSWQLDPVTLVSIGAGLGASVIAIGRRGWPLAIGIVAYVAYVVWIGGDFMSGRFLSAPVLAAALILARMPLPAERWWGIAPAAAALGVGLLAPSPNLLSGSDFNRLQVNRWSDGLITDERHYYWRATGLISVDRVEAPPQDRLAARGREYRDQRVRAAAESSIGFLGFEAGPEVHLIDSAALADPLLARLPHRLPPVRVGHLYRRIPDGYLEFMKGEASGLTEPALDEYNRHLMSVTRGPLWSWTRWADIFAMNAGRFDGLIAQSSYGPRHVPQESLITRIPDGTPAGSPNTVLILEGGVLVDLAASQMLRGFEVSLDANDAYYIRIRLAGRLVAESQIAAVTDGRQGLRTEYVTLQEPVKADQIEIRAGVGDRRTALGHLRVR